LRDWRERAEIAFLIPATSTSARRCADANHPMIDRLWTARIDLADFVLATKPGSNIGFPFARSAKAFAREPVKSFVNG
jgi:hypothetical protein